MKSTTLRRALAGSIALAALVALAPAYVLLNPPRKWFSARTFTICMASGENSLAPGFTQAACAAGVAAWAEPLAGSGPFSSVASASLGNVGFNGNDGLSTISYEDPQHALSSGTLAATTVGFYSTSQTMTTNGTTFFAFTDADVVFNNGIDFTSLGDAKQNGANGNQYDMEGIAVHEVGHAIGLAHDPVEQSTMYATFSAHDYRKRTLDDVDANGGRHIYAANSQPVTFAAGSQLTVDTALLGLSTATFKPNSKVYARITVLDENGNTVPGASVTVSVT
ncbi:MAG: matrixin family metalloprotease, partial [Planctomycetota bacterium]